jgi:CrcB protein
MSESASERLTAAVLVGVGGFLGAVSRHGVDVLIGATAFPLGTLAVNLVGSFVLGALTPALGPRRLRLFLATGLLSSFTTYSAFAVETVRLGPLLGATNVVATYALGILAAMAGLAVGHGGVSGVGHDSGGRR